MKQDNGSGDNIIGKSFSLKLQESKLDTHYTKASHWLGLTGLGMSEIDANPALRQQFEFLVLQVNNLGEEKTLAATTQNYIIRLIETSSGRKLETQDVYAEWKIDGIKGTLQSAYASLGSQIAYGRTTFRSQTGEWMKELEQRIRLESALIQ